MKFRQVVALVAITAVIWCTTDAGTAGSVPMLQCLPNIPCATANSSVQYVSERQDVVADPSFWCPEGHRPYKINFQCTPMSCVQRPKTTLCEDLSANLTSNCTKMFLTESEYEISRDDGSLHNRLANETLALGDYWAMGGRAVVCGPEDTPADRLASIPPKCIRGVLSGETFRTLPNGSLSVVHSGRIVPPGYFKTNGSTVDACIPMDVQLWAGCLQSQRGSFDAGEFELLPDMDARVSRRAGATFGPERYVVTADHSRLIVCLLNPGAIKRRETQVLYGSAFTVSAIFLALALVAHAFFPALNYHTKTLLCLSFSLLVFYLTSAIYQFNGGSFLAPAANVALFVIRYIFGLSVFFWISIIAFDLWRVFSKMKGSITVSDSKRKRQMFYIKCALAYGIPTLMYVIVACVAFSPSAQQNVGFAFHPLERSWFSDDKELWVFFYGPIAVLLAENLLLFVLTIVSIKKASKGTDMVNKRASRKLIRVYAKLYIVLGVGWILEVVSAAVNHRVDEAVWYVTDLLNCLQGVFIFLIYVCKKRTWLILRQKLGYVTASRAAESTTSTQGGSDDNKTAIQMNDLGPQGPAPGDHKGSNGQYHTG